MVSNDGEELLELTGEPWADIQGRAIYANDYGGGCPAQDPAT
ncbi:hypothetical protein ACLF6K_01095 [Streptomyces xanthophaeus]